MPRGHGFLTSAELMELGGFDSVEDLKNEIADIPRVEIGDSFLILEKDFVEWIERNAKISED